MVAMHQLIMSFAEQLGIDLLGGVSEPLLALIPTNL